MIRVDDPRLVRLERSPRAAWIWHPGAGRIVWANDPAARLWGLADGFLLVDRPFGPLDPAFSDHELLSEGARRSEGLEGEVRAWHARGERRIQVMARLFARSGEGDFFLFTSMPPQSEAGPVQPGTEDPVHQLLSSFPLALGLFTGDGRCAYANAALERLAAGIKAPPLAYLTGSREAAERLIRALIGAGSLRTAPIITIRGRPMTLQIDAARVKDPRSRRGAFLIAAHDISARRARETRTAAQLGLVKSVLDRAAEGWVVLDGDLRTITYGGPALDRAGTKGAKAIGRPWREGFDALGLSVPARLGLALKERRPLSGLPLAVRGPYLDVVPVTDDGGDFAGFHLILRSRREWTGTLAAGLSAHQAPPPRPERRAADSAAVRLASAALIAHDNFEIVFANARAARLLGVASEAELVGRPLLGFFPTDERRAGAHYDTLKSGGRFDSAVRLKALTADGRPVVLDGEFRAARLKGRPVVLAVLTDVTALAQAEENVLKQTNEATQWFDQAPIALALLDAHGRMLKANAEAARLFETGPIEALGKSFEQLLDPSSRAAFDIRRAAAHAPGAERAPLAFEAIIRPRADRPRPVSITLRSVMSSGAPSTLVAVADLSQTRAKQAELERAVEAAGDSNRQKTSFLAAISHEMRTPLNAIIGFTEVMKEGRLGPIGNERYAGYIEDIHMSGQHLLSLVNDLLDMSKIEAGRYELSFEPVTVETVLDQAMRILRPQADKRGIVFSARLPAVLPQVMADERSLKQILINLFSNAIKFTDAGGSVTVTAAFDPLEGLRLTVADTGIGMTADELARALEPFRQVRRAANDEPGTGLGLPLARALAEANHAHFHIESRRSEGTRVDIVFPAGQVVVPDSAATALPT